MLNINVNRFPFPFNNNLLQTMELIYSHAEFILYKMHGKGRKS